MFKHDHVNDHVVILNFFVNTFEYKKPFQLLWQ